MTDQFITPPFGVLFDMDGVIIDSNPFHKICLERFFKKHQIYLSEANLVQRVYGRRNVEWIPYVFGRSLTPEEIQQYAEEKEQMFRKLYKDAIQPVEGLSEFLARLQEARIPCAIATSAPKANLNFTLSHTHLGHFFQAVIYDEMVANGKPNPEVYLKAASTIGLPPKKCLVFEDSLSGIEAGKEAGCIVIGITTSHSYQELHRADLTIDNFTQLKPTTLQPLFNNIKQH
ncbi:HAD family phosphatase [Rapidithrix thailandica]|uniref:HAD family phosphatase n=1 Tax=Rapidithrix thailandica TaxID=413964 RepID=A0AAW9SG22_9BACT